MLQLQFSPIQLLIDLLKEVIEVDCLMLFGSEFHDMPPRKLVLCAHTGFVDEMKVSFLKLSKFRYYSIWNQIHVFCCKFCL